MALTGYGRSRCFGASDDFAYRVIAKLNFLLRRGELNHRDMRNTESFLVPLFPTVSLELQSDHR